MAKDIHKTKSVPIPIILEIPQNIFPLLRSATVVKRFEIATVRTRKRY
jgi:hypothetical protein